MTNVNGSYNAVAKIFHWLTVVLIAGAFGLSLIMEDLPSGPDKFKIYALHKSIGISVLTVTALRLVWRLLFPPPAAVPGLTPLEKKLSSATHAALYTLMIAMPLSGWAMSSAAGFPVNVFGFFVLPDFVSPDKMLAEGLEEFHEAIGTLIVIISGVHAAAALMHHYIKRDDVLRRMLPALVFLLPLFPAPAAAAPANWYVKQRESSIAFTAKQMGADVEGRFGLFTASIVFDPDNLKASRALVDIDTGTIDTKSADRDETLRGKEWFDVAQFPIARFETVTFRKTGEGYEADANLTIRNKTVSVTLPFTLTISQIESEKDSLAVMDGKVILDRSKFDLGGGTWRDTSVIANDVTVKIHLVARTSLPKS